MDKNNKNPKHKAKNTNNEDEDILYHPVTGKKLEPPKKNVRKKKLFNLKSEYAVFYIVTLIIAVLVSIILFAYMLNRVRVESPQIDTSFNIENNEDNLDTMADDEGVTSLGVIHHIDSVNRVMHIYDIASRNTIILNIEGSTVLRDRFGQGLVFAEFSLGDIVNSNFNPSNNTVYSLEISNQAWERRLISGIEVNPTNNTITSGQDRFIYTDRTLVFNSGQLSNILDIHPLSIVTMRGVDNIVWFIEIERGFGTIRVINDNQILNGSMEISRSISMALGESVDIRDKEVNMPEGTHRITVRGSNIAPYTQEIIVNNGETTIVDLSVVPLTSGILTITTNVPTAVVAINGRQVDITQPLSLNYGEYSISAQSPGYQPFQATVTLNTPNQQFHVTLEPEIVTGRIDIRSTPAGAEALVDNAFIGITPVTANIEQGSRNITLRKDGFISTTMSVDVSNDPISVLIELQPEIQLPTPVEVQPTPSPTVPLPPNYTFVPGPGE